MRKVAVNNPVKVRLIRQLKEAGTYIESDEEVVNLYAETHQLYQNMRTELSKKGLLFEHTNKIGAKNITKNPLALEILKSSQLLFNLLQSMGLTPAQRKKSVSTDMHEKDEFELF